jgi:single-strand selective monofunctional uracil DNA glycosylase
LRAAVEALEPEWVVGVGKFAAGRAQAVLGNSARIATMLHPSPASPSANRGWAERALAELVEQGVPV